MSLSNGSFDLQLRKSIEVHGVDGEADTLTFHECGEGSDGYYMKLRKHVVSAQMKAPEMMEKLRGFMDAVKDSDGVAAGEELKKLHQVDETKHEDEAAGMAEFLKIMLGTSDELEEMVKVFGRLVSENGGTAVCTVGENRVKEAAWKRVHPEDKIDAAVKYCAFFGIGLDSAPKNAFANASDSHTEAKAL